VTVAQAPSPEGDGLPDVSGRYLLLEDEVEFVPHFPFERDVKYRASFHPQALGAPLAAQSLNLEFLIPSAQKAPELTEVTDIFLPAISCQKICFDSMFVFRTRCSADER
jgi:hypothetical protein